MHETKNRLGGWRRHGLILSATVAVATSMPARATAQESWDWTGRIPAGRTIEIKGVLGDVRAELASGAEVEVVATKHARDDDPDEVRIEVLEHDDGVTICAVYPSRRGRPNECAPGDEGRMNTRDNDVNVDFVVRVPRGVRFVGKTVNGSVEAQRLESDVVANTVNGDVTVSTTGIAQGRTVNGSIEAAMGRADWTGDLDFETVNGGITLDLPANFEAEVRAGTVNGSISTDFPLRVEGKFSGRRIRGTIGSGGGRELNLATVNGSIRLRRSS